jgi:DNA-binding NtrC family response regulator
VLEAVNLCGFQRCIVVDRLSEALHVMAAGPSVALFPIESGRVDGMRAERALHAANELVPLMAYGSTQNPSALQRILAAGVTTYIEEPLTPELIAGHLQAVRELTDPVAQAVRASVGVTDLKAMQRFVRETMCTEALTRVQGSRRGAARLLGVDRRAVQKLLDQMQGNNHSLST